MAVSVRHKGAVIRTVAVFTVFLFVGLVIYLNLFRQPLPRFKTRLFKETEDRPIYIPGSTGRAHQLGKVRTFEGRRELTPVKSCLSYNTKSGRNCEQWIVVTTIFSATEILRKISSLPGWCMVVVADKKGPVSMSIPNVDYLDVIQQESCGYQICRLLRWNHFSRKNIGYMYAIEHGAKVIYDTDDDNEPLAGAMPVFEVAYSRHVQISADLWNPYPEFGPDITIWPRGFPLNRITDISTKRVEVSDEAAADQVGVVQFLAQHDPDVDAIYRLTRELPYDFHTESRRLVVPSRVLSPYNAQATLHGQAAFWGMLLPASVHGRVTDIWRSYFTQRLLWDVGKHVAFHSPSVVQHRNPHNYLADFDAEMDLYYKAGNLAKFLLEWTPNPRSNSLQQRLFDLYIELYEYGFIEADDVALIEAWIQDLECQGYKFPSVVDSVNKRGKLKRTENNV